MMTARFSINYSTEFGQQLFICGSHPKLGNWEASKASPLVFKGNRHWDFELPLKVGLNLVYKYFINHKNGDIEWEFGPNRVHNLDGDCTVIDHWRSNHDNQNVLNTSPFKKAFFARPSLERSSKITKTSNVVFQIRAQVEPDQHLCIVGNCDALGNWDPKKAKPLGDKEYPNWTIGISLPKDVSDVEYKYCFYNKKTKEVTSYESGPNRHLLVDRLSRFLVNDEHFNHPKGDWKGAGVAIPVFAIRTNSGFGVGEFLDIKLLVDWAKKTGLKLIQLLPVNDTIATHSWVDSYPYAGISVFALHPIYANLKAIGSLKDTRQQNRFKKLHKKLNKLETVDYEEVLKAKSEFFKSKFDEDSESFLKSKPFKDFFAKNKKWLLPYAVFSYLRDLYGTADFSKWQNYNTVNEKELSKLADPKTTHFEHIAVHYYIQFHLDKQLKEATSYARKNNVVLKGDIPIGIYRNSVDAWIAPHLYNMDSQSGAPPDAFSISGQNWGFPTYNWEVMAKDGYAWWKERLSKMADFFDVFRIDHILGFFRIWEIPWSAVEGTLGRFNPALPITVNELTSWGIDFSNDRLCRPYIRDYIVNEIFKENSWGGQNWLSRPGLSGGLQPQA